jgi:hypothetical protein
MGYAVYPHPNNPELAYVPLGLRFSVVWRSLVGTVECGPVVMVTSIVVGMLAGTPIHVRGLASRFPDHVLCNLCIADFGVLNTLYQLASRHFHVNVDCIFPRDISGCTLAWIGSAFAGGK